MSSKNVLIYFSLILAIVGFIVTMWGNPDELFHLELSIALVISFVGVVIIDRIGDVITLLEEQSPKSKIEVDGTI